jgi:Fuc2NAc and GlcNAc transferase
MVNWGLLVVVLLGSAVTTAILRQLALRNQLLDVPVARSAHSHPVPTSGGAAIALSFFLALGFVFSNDSFPTTVILALFGGGLLAIVGYVDDLRHLRIRTRIPFQFLAAIWAIWWLGDAPQIVVGTVVVDFPALVHVFSVVALVWLLNLFNFMDGIDGLAASEASYVTAIASIFAFNSADDVVMLLSGLICAATLGFLAWNWAPAKIFMGDCGSSFLGFALGLLALLSMQNDSLNLWVWLLLLGVFVVDATYTLFRRALNGQRWYTGHNTHAYQMAARQFGSHRKVTLLVLMINVLWLTPLAWLAFIRPHWGVYLAAIGLSPLVMVAVYFRAGTTANRITN